MLGVDEGTGSAHFLSLGDNRQSQGGFTRGFRTVDLDDTAFWQAANAQGNVQAQGAGGNGRNRLALVIAHAHDRAFTELTLDLPQGRSQGALLVVVH
ncbi:hypothetical protein D3C86_1977750 [compost metagenome]